MRNTIHTFVILTCLRTEAPYVSSPIPESAEKPLHEDLR
jgi:hypothetical protein